MFNLDTLNCVYLILFFIGVGYAIFILITGGLSDIDLPNVDIDVPQVDLPGGVDVPGADIHIGGPDVPAGGLDTPDVAVSPLSPITIASFITSFGGIGVLSLQFFNVDPRLSLVFATVGGVAISGVMFLFYSQILVRAQGSSQVQRGEIIGQPAEVLVSITKAAPGQVAYSTKAGRMTSLARSSDGSEIPRGQWVKIVNVVGPQVLVAPVPPTAEEDDHG